MSCVCQHAVPEEGSWREMAPAVGCRRPARTCSRVVLPAPLRPYSNPRELAGRSSVAPFTMGTGAAARSRQLRCCSAQLACSPLQAVCLQQVSMMTSWKVRNGCLESSSAGNICMQGRGAELGLDQLPPACAAPRLSRQALQGTYACKGGEQSLAWISCLQHVQPPGSAGRLHA